jgi:hypothetical protein
MLPTESENCYRDPVVARYVRHLYIDTRFIEVLLKRQGSQNLRTKLKKWIVKLSKSTRNSELTSNRHETSIAASSPKNATSASRKLMSVMTKAIMGMANITECALDWRSLPLNEGTLAFFAASRRAFSSSLRKLTLRSHVAKFQDILVVTNFHGVEELVVDFEFDFHVKDDIRAAAAVATGNQMVLVKHVSPFINNLGPSLRSLTIRTWAKGSHSQFFHALGPFPNLQFLSVQVQFDKHQLQELSGLFHFLRTHTSALRDLEIRPNRLYGSWYGMESSSKEHWLRLSRQYLPEIALHANLDSLTITSLDHRLALSLINDNIASITSLWLLDRYLNVSEVAEIVRLFKHRPSQLKSLSLELATITPQLLDTLAGGLPRLASLALVIEDDNVSNVYP